MNLLPSPSPSLPAEDGLGASIAASWQRCRGMGLERGDDPLPNLVSVPELRRLLERDRLLAKVARQELQTLSQAIVDTEHVALLLDDSGRIVSVAGDIAHTGPVLRHARSGVDCSELHFGTTAPGTALVERRPLTVRRSEHFFRNLQHMECLAAPIFQPGGELIGVLDVSCETRPLLPGLAELVHGSVLRIERLLLRALGSPLVLRLHPHPDCLGTPLEGLIALGRDGEVLGLNSPAARLLGLAQAQAVGRSIDQLLGAGLAQLGAGGTAQLSTPAGMKLSATLAEAPDLERRQPVRRTAAPPAADPPPEKLTRRELKILQQLDSGLSNREIARSLFISEGTLKWHLQNIYGKLASHSRTATLAKARRLGLLASPG